MAKSKKNTAKQTLSYRHSNKRKNNPHVGMVDTASDGVEGQTTWAYDPHIDPTLNFDTVRAGIENLIDDALASDDEAVMRRALEQLKRMQAPYLNWTGKAERTSFEVDTVSLHVHERIDPATILASVQKRLKSARSKGYAFQPDLFAAPFENLPLREAIDFYKHERDWANRLIAGDSLLVMNSLLQKEGMAGQVQMIYLDPPYGIKYGSNFQPFTHKRDVKDRSDNDLTQEPEMIKAFRDTWELGIHSYLSYLRDRLLLAKELLNESGSVFVQISDENVHHVREIMDEVFGSSNFVGQITFQKTGGLVSDYMVRTVDYLIWYGKDQNKTKWNPLFEFRKEGQKSLQRYDQFRTRTGEIRRLSPDGEVPDGGKRLQLTSLESANPYEYFEFRGMNYSQRWKTNNTGRKRLSKTDRIVPQGKKLRYIRYVEDFPVIPITDRWESMQIGTELTYVVQTSESALERCLLMTTDPGDLVLDPTCGSGTTAFVAEKWGRRWITTDTSRVAVTLAKQRLTTASYDYYDLKYPHEGLKGGFIYKTVPHITLKSIANNAEIDEIYERLHPAVEGALEELNGSLIKKSLTPTPLPEGEGLQKNPRPEGEGLNNNPRPLGEGGPELVEGPGEGKTVVAPNLLKLARKLRTEQTDAEQMLWHLLRSRRFFKAKFRRQHPVAPYVLDFYCHEERLGIELDGGQHNEPDKRHTDKERTAFLESKGIRILRFWNNEVLQETEAVLERLYQTLTPTPLPEGEGLQKNPRPEGEGLNNNPRPLGEGGPELVEGPGEGEGLREWEVPFDFPDDWPEVAREPFDAFHAARRAMQKKMDESIAAQADRETLYDQPQISKTKLRITGPFTVEAVPFPTVLGLDEAEQPGEADASVARSGETARQGQWRDELLKAGIRGKGGQQLKLADLEPLPDARYIHAVGTVAETGERVAVSFGPEHAALEQRQVEIAMREAGELFPLPKMLVFCAFTFDPEAAKDIDNIKGITALKAQMNTDLLTEDLKKARTSNESFWLMGQPDVEVHRLKSGRYQVEVHGFDYFDTKTGELQSGGKRNIAMWVLDTDYDDRSLFPKQIFFPMSGAKDGWNKLKKDIKAELNEDLLTQFQGTKSLPFKPGENQRIAVKIVDDRGIESLKVMDITD